MDAEKDNHTDGSSDARPVTLGLLGLWRTESKRKFVRLNGRLFMPAARQIGK